MLLTIEDDDGVKRGGKVLCWMVPKEGYRVLMLQLKDLSVGQWEEPCIGLTQENSIESSVQNSLPYIQIPNGLCELFLTCPKQPCVCLKVNMCFTYCIMSSFQNLLHPSMHHVTCDCVI